MCCFQLLLSNSACAATPRFIAHREDRSPENASGPDEVVALFDAQQRRFDGQGAAAGRLAATASVAAAAATATDDKDNEEEKVEEVEREGEEGEEEEEDVSGGEEDEHDVGGEDDE